MVLPTLKRAPFSNIGVLPKIYCPLESVRYRTKTYDNGQL